MGRFIILEELGRGGMGVVHAAYDPQLDRRVAVKLLRHGAAGSEWRSSGGQTRLLREAQAMAKLSHPNVVTIYEVGTIGTDVFLAMELICGLTLRGWSNAEARPRTWKEVVAVMRQAGRGLAAAHRAGLVHRDFKPDNVLIDREGRVCVADFGLARTPQGRSEPEMSSGPASREVQQVALTEMGAVVGTPVYMAPEQLGGGSFDARSDQYSFCVTFYEALYHVRPFASGAVDDMLERKLQGPPVPSPLHDVPAWLQRMVQRGMHPDPARRYLDMDALLEALDRSMTSRAWRIGGSVLLAGLALTGWAYAYALPPRARDLPASCQHVESRMEGIWDDARKQTIARAFASTPLPYAADTWARLELRLDEYAEQWSQAQHQTCDATWVDHTQSEALLAVRQVCLDQRLSELRAYSTVLLRAETDRDVVLKAADGVEHLRDPSECRDVQSMHIELPLPAEGASAARVVELRQRVDDVRALTVAGRVDEALDVGMRVQSDAESLGFLPLLAEIRLELGIAYDDAGRYDEASAILEQGLWDAEVSRHDAISVDVWSRWIRVVGYHMRQLERAEPMLVRLDAAMNRLGDDPLREAAVLKVRGTLAFAQGRNDDALIGFARAAKILERELGRGAGRTNSARQAVGTVLYRLGRLEESAAVLEEVLATGIALFGAQHPVTGANLLSLGNLALEQHDFESAVRYHEQATAIFVATFEESHPAVAHFQRTYGESLLAAGRHEEAIAVLRQALDSARASKSDSDPARVALMLGHALLKAGQPEQAVEPLESVLLPSMPKPEPDDEGIYIRASFDLAQALWEVQPPERERALELARTTLGALESAGPRANVEVSWAEVERWLVEHERVATAAGHALEHRRRRR